jgi:hypothetical protein
MSDNDLRAHIRLSGRGRLTKTRPYDLEFRLNRINEILKVGLGVQQILEGN